MKSFDKLSNPVTASELRQLAEMGKSMLIFIKADAHTEWLGFSIYKALNSAAKVIDAEKSCKWHGEYTEETTPCCIHKAIRDAAPKDT